MSSGRIPQRLPLRCLLLCALLLPGLYAQDTSEEAEEALEDDSPAWTFRFTPRALYRFGTPLDNGGRVDVLSLHYALGLDYAFSKGTSLGASLDYGSHSYGFEGNRGFGALDPWERIQTLRLGASFRARFGRVLGVFASPSVRYAGENRARFSDSLSWGAILGLSIGLSADLQIGVVVALSQRLDGDFRALPLPYLRWRFAERFTLSTRLRTLSGGGLELAYAALKELELAVGFGYTSLEFRTNEENIGRDSHWPLVARVSWQVSDTFALDLFGGVAFAGRLELDNPRGRRIEKEDYDAAAFVGLQLQIGF